MNGGSIKTKLHKTSSTIRFRISMITITILVLISGIVTLISYYLVSNNLRQNQLQTSEIRLSLVGSSIDSNIDSVTSYIRSCQISDKIKKFAMESDSSNRTKREAHDFAANMYTPNTALSSHLIRLIIMGKNRSDIIQFVDAPRSTVNVSPDAILSLPYFDQLHDEPGQSSTGILYDPFYTTRQIPMIPFLYSIQHPYTVDEIGYIFAEMSVSTLTDPLINYPDVANYQIYFQLGENLYQYADGTLIPCHDTLAAAKSISYTVLHESTSIQSLRFAETGKSCLVVSHPLTINGWSIMVCVNEQELSQNILHSFLFILLTIVIVASFIGYILFKFLSQTINVPVAQLQMRIRRIEEGDFSTDDSTEWDHELGDIGKTINHLSENVLQLMEQRIEDERQKKDYEYQMLQSQINPHFIHNTLNSIKWMATIQNATGIGEMVTALARILKRISNGSTILIPIKQELALIEDYFTIQQYRYGGTITLSIQADDDLLLDCPILKFTLQPLIENAIFHGIEPKGTTGSIHIHIFQDNQDNVHIDICDDGVGIDPHIAATLLEENISTSSSSFFKEIGLANVHKRLQFEFGPNYGLSINSVPGQGTIVTVLLPFARNEAPYD